MPVSLATLRPPIDSIRFTPNREFAYPNRKYRASDSNMTKMHLAASVWVWFQMKSPNKIIGKR